MFNKKNYKKIVISILALTMIFGTVALAAEGIYTKQLKATYGRIKFNYEGSDVTKQIESKYGTPAFTTEDGRSYAPVRAMADLLGVDIEYDTKTHTVKITDPKVEEFNKKLAEKDKEIEKLKKELNTKKEEAKKEEVNKADLKSLEKDLNKKYDEYEKVEFDIVLKESKDTITIDINTDLTNTRDEQNWIRMRHTDKKSLIEDVAAAVRKAFPNTAITGNIYDSYSRKNLYTFSQSKTGSLSVSNRDYVDDRYYDDYDYRRLDSYVESRFEKYGITGAKLNSYYEISFTDNKKNEDAWYDLRPRDIENLLNDIAGEIEYEYGYGSNYIELDIKIGSYYLGTYDRYGDFIEDRR